MREQLATALALLPEASIASLARELADDELARLVAADPEAFAEAVLGHAGEGVPNAGPPPDDEEDSDDDSSDDGANDDTGNDRQIERRPRTPNREEVLAAIRSAAPFGIAKRRIVAITGLGNNSVQAQLIRLKEDKLVHVVGRAKAARYHVTT